MSLTTNNWSGFGTKEYYVESNETNSEDYGQARTKCNDLGGILASVTSSDIQLHLSNVIPYADAPNGTARKFWIGAERSSHTSTWKWQTNATFNYTNWQPGEGSANETSTNEDCGSIFSNFDFKWFTSNCNTNYFGYICQRDAEITTTVETNTSTSALSPIASHTNAQTEATTVMNTTAVTILNEMTTTTTSKQEFLNAAFPTIQVVVPLILGILVICAIVVGIVLYKRRYSKSTSWEQMDTPHNTEGENSSDIPTPLPTTDVVHIESDPSALVTFKKQDHTFANPTYTHYEIPIPNSKHQKAPNTQGLASIDEYVDIYSSSSKSKAYTGNYSGS